MLHCHADFRQRRYFAAPDRVVLDCANGYQKENQKENQKEFNKIEENWREEVSQAPGK